MTSTAATGSAPAIAPVTVPGAASALDVLMCYQVILGRDPESSFVVEAARGQPLPQVVASFLRSAEFRDGALAAALSRRPLPHEALAEGPSAQQLAWALRHLPGAARAGAPTTGDAGWEAMAALLARAAGATADPSPTTPEPPPPPVTPEVGALAAMRARLDSLEAELRALVSEMAAIGQDVRRLLADRDRA